ncbi:MOSC domain-containing protein [Nakamurella deserti]|uniref:MOSC domain-containing protein n=1 Tax=Nakamurella deserti TaxID=2164074 RepID=UPI000DBE5432|nr:MOSC domain-containing protein [Nakamurella deserti]
MSAVRSVNLASSPLQLPGRTRLSGMDKRPVRGAVDVFAPGPKGLAGGGLAGDTVCDLRYHGGDDQAVYAYAREDLDWWQAELGRDLPDGCFGENLTTSGINITSALVGEQWLVGGSLLLQVTVPRIPCRSFQAALGEKRWVKRFTERGVSGTYLRVLRGGPVTAGDSIVVVERPHHQISNWTAFRAITVEPELLDLMVDVPDLPDELRRTAAKRAKAMAR